MEIQPFTSGVDGMMLGGSKDHELSDLLSCQARKFSRDRRYGDNKKPLCMTTTHDNAIKATITTGDYD